MDTKIESTAPEVEPVAWMNKDGYITLYRQGDAIIPLYTHPDNDGLQKAAEALLNEVKDIIFDSKLATAKKNLSAELNKGK